jgi:tetratricopeptide (TPR) repeat protein
MPVLEIHRRTGDVETRELSKQIPLLVGRLPTNDIRIEGDGIAPVHCRISWNRRNFEVAAVTPAGVEWNGATVQQAMLSSGDVVRVGNVEIVLQAELGGAAAENAPGSPVLPVGRFLGPKAALAEQPEAADDDGERPAAPGADTDLPVRAFHFSDELSDDSERPLPEPRPVPETASPPAVARRAGMNRVVGVPPLSTEHGPPETSLKGPAETEEERKTRELLESAARLKQKLKVPMRRPGEQEVLRSPVVVGLLVGTLLLLLSAATIWFVLSREAAQHEFDAARALMESGQFAQSVEAFEQFLRDRPRHRLAPEARLAIATAKVEQPMSGGVPAWDAGLEALGGFIAEYRDTDAFHDAQSTVRKYVLQTADHIAFGAAETARTAHKRPLLVVSADAAKMLVLYSPSEAPPNERLEELARAVRAAEASILQQETFDGMLGKLDAALAANTPLAALPEYRRLLDRYPAATDYRLLNDRLKKTLDLGRSQIVRDESRREAIRENRAPPQASPPLTLARRIRTRSDATSAGGPCSSWRRTRSTASTRRTANHSGGGSSASTRRFSRSP